MNKQAELGLNLSTRRTRKAVFLDEMELVVPWRELVGLIAAASPVAPTGRPPFAHETMLRIHFLQQWFGLSDLAMEEALFETPLYRDFVGLSGVQRIPDCVSILRFGKTPSPRHLLEEHQLSPQILATVNATLTAKGLMLKSATVVDATLIAAPSSTKNKDGERGPEMHQTKKGNQWHFGMKAPVRACEGALPGTGQEHGAVAHAVCVEQTVDGTPPTAAEGARMSAPAACPWTWARPQKIGKSAPAALKLVETDTAVSCRGIHPVRQLRQTGFGHHPLCGY
jgi:hypothetical protein